MTSLVQSAIQPTTKKSYERSLCLYQTFCKEKLGNISVFPISVQNFGLFITALFTQGLQYSTIQGHVSALSYYHKLYGHHDPAQSFYITKLLAGIHKKLPSNDARCAIDKHILGHLVPCIELCTVSDYDHVMYTSMFLLAYFVCLRIGELVYSNNMANVLQYHQLSCVKRDTQVVAYQLQFLNYKHSTQKPTMRINPQEAGLGCPVHWLTRYLSLRGTKPGPLYITRTGTFVTRSQFCSVLDRTLAMAGLDKNCFGTHSFRIGRCTDMAREGFSDTQIKLVGRWKSDAFKKYIRPNIIQL